MSAPVSRAITLHLGPSARCPEAHIPSGDTARLAVPVPRLYLPSRSYDLASSAVKTKTRRRELYPQGPPPPQPCSSACLPRVTLKVTWHICSLHPPSRLSPKAHRHTTSSGVKARDTAANLPGASRPFTAVPCPLCSQRQDSSKEMRCPQLCFLPCPSLLHLPLIPLSPAPCYECSQPSQALPTLEE